MIGRQFLAIIKPIEEPGFIDVVEVLHSNEETFFDESNFFEQSKNGFNSPGLVMNNQIKYMSFLVFRIDNRDTMRLPEESLLYDVTGLTKSHIDKIKKVSYKRFKEIVLTNQGEGVNEHLAVQHPNAEIFKDIDTHIQELQKLGYDKSELVERLQEFLDEKYKHLGMKVQLGEI